MRNGPTGLPKTNDTRVGIVLSNENGRMFTFFHMFNKQKLDFEQYQLWMDGEDPQQPQTRPAITCGWITSSMYSLAYVLGDWGESR